MHLFLYLAESVPSLERFRSKPEAAAQQANIIASLKYVKFLRPVLFIDQVLAYSPILCLPLRHSCTVEKNKSTCSRHQFKAALAAKYFVHQLGQRILRIEKYNGHDLPRAGCLLEDRPQSCRTPPLSTMAGCGRSVPFASPVPRHLPPFRIQDVVGSKPKHLTAFELDKGEETLRAGPRLVYKHTRTGADWRQEYMGERSFGIVIAGEHMKLRYSTVHNSASERLVACAYRCSNGEVVTL